MWVTSETEDLDIEDEIKQVMEGNKRLVFLNSGGETRGMIEHIERDLCTLEVVGAKVLFSSISYAVLNGRIDFNLFIKGVQSANMYISIKDGLLIEMVDKV